MSDAEACRDFAIEVVSRLRQAGYQALWAGGCVRDLILGLVPADYDVATDATPEQVMRASLLRRHRGDGVWRGASAPASPVGHRG